MKQRRVFLRQRFVRVEVLKTSVDAEINEKFDCGNGLDDVVFTVQMLVLVHDRLGDFRFVDASFQHVHDERGQGNQFLRFELVLKNVRRGNFGLLAGFNGAFFPVEIKRQGVFARFGTAIAGRFQLAFVDCPDVFAAGFFSRRQLLVQTIIDFCPVFALKHAFALDGGDDRLDVPDEDQAHCQHQSHQKEDEGGCFDAAEFRQIGADAVLSGLKSGGDAVEYCGKVKDLVCHCFFQGTIYKRLFSV